MPSLESRVKELARMGFKRVYVPKDSFMRGYNKSDGIEIIELKTLNQVIQHVYN